jgi:hypothetical protein
MQSVGISGIALEDFFIGRGRLLKASRSLVLQT